MMNGLLAASKLGPGSHEYTGKYKHTGRLGKHKRGGGGGGGGGIIISAAPSPSVPIIVTRGYQSVGPH